MKTSPAMSLRISNSTRSANHQSSTSSRTRSDGRPITARPSRSATGRCIVAFGDYAEDELKEKFDALRWDEPPTFDDWKAQIEKTRSDGFAVDEGNYISGVTVVAAPVWKTRDKLSHALVAIGISSSLNRNGLPLLQEALLKNAQILSNQLSGEL